MPSLDLTGANWGKINPDIINMLREPSGKISKRSITFLIELAEDIFWPVTQIPEIVFHSRLGRFITAQGTFESLLALVKDENVMCVDADRLMFMECSSISHLVQRSRGAL